MSTFDPTLAQRAELASNGASRPQWSGDGQWWWDGQSWIPAAQAQLAIGVPRPDAGSGSGASETVILEVHPTLTFSNALSVSRVRSYWVLTSQRLITKSKGLLTAHEDSIPVRRIRNVQSEQGLIAGWVTITTETDQRQIGPLGREDTKNLTEAVTKLVMANQNREQNYHVDSTGR